MAKSARNSLPYSSTRVIGRSTKRQTTAGGKDSNGLRATGGRLEYGNVFELPDEDEEPPLIKMRKDILDRRLNQSRHPRERSIEPDEDHLRICHPRGDMLIDEDEEIYSDDASGGEESQTELDRQIFNAKSARANEPPPVEYEDRDAQNLTELSTWLDSLPSHAPSSSSTLASPAVESQKLQVEDLVKTAELHGLDSMSLAKLKRSSRIVSGATPNTGPTPVPLPLRQQQRLEREAAYSRTKEVIKQWEPTMASIAGAQHLIFPLQSNAENTSKRHLQLETLTTPQPINDFESAIDRLIRDAKLRDTEDISDLETNQTVSSKLQGNLAPNLHSDLRRARSLIAREQAKASRQARIKSKTYRKMQRRTAENGATYEVPDDEDAERARALERATLRHKNGSRWISSQRKGGALFETKRNDVSRALQRDEELRQRIAQTSSKRTRRDDQEVFPLEVAATDAELVLREDSPVMIPSKPSRSGRYHYVGLTDQPSTLEDPRIKRIESSADEVATLFHEPTTSSIQPPRNSTIHLSPISNPWLAPEGDSPKRPSTNTNGRGTPIGRMDDRNTLLKVDQLMPLKAGSMEGEQGLDLGIETSRETPLAESTPLWKPSLKQRDLVARAFADDSVIEEFREVKRKLDQTLVADDASNAVAGWGNWTGNGLKFRKRDQRLPPQRANRAPKPQRKDFRKAHVIISEKKDDKLTRYQAKDLPFPFTNKAQFERSMAAPIGSEWNTRAAHQKATLPRVSTKIGAVITPLRNEIE